MNARINALGLPAVLSGGVDFRQLMLSPADLALTDLTAVTETRIANLLGVPGYMVGLPQSSDSLVYNTAALTLDFHWRVTLRNLVRQVIGALSAWALPFNTAIELNRDEYVQPTPLGAGPVLDDADRRRDDAPPRRPASRNGSTRRRRPPRLPRGCCNDRRPTDLAPGYALPDGMVAQWRSVGRVADVTKRVITVVAVPYDEDTDVIEGDRDLHRTVRPSARSTASKPAPGESPSTGTTTCAAWSARSTPSTPPDPKDWSLNCG